MVYIHTYLPIIDAQSIPSYPQSGFTKATIYINTIS